MRRREEVFNTKLADALSHRGVDAEAEAIVQHAGGRKLPDVQVRWMGLPLVLECKFDTDAGARVEVETQAKERLDLAFGAVAVAVLYSHEPTLYPLRRRKPATRVPSWRGTYER